ncbi:sigma-70 family RNA polymerase sigma factor [bacterium]|nr:sigma-70 family RNA polymerase sigma factor [bacterium]
MSIVPNEGVTDLPGSNPSPLEWSFGEILAEARDGSPTSLGRLFELKRKYLLTVAHRQIGADLQGKVGASDLVQETFVEAQKGFERFQGTTEVEFLAWLSAILTNRFSNIARHHRLTQKRAIGRNISDAAASIAIRQAMSDMLTPSTQLVAEEEKRRLHVALDSLPAEVREILLMRIWQRASFSEISTALGCSPEAARKRFLRAVEELQALLSW